MSKSLDEIRDELVDTACARWANWRGLSTFEKKQLQNDFQAMFNASTKIHQEKYDALMVEAKKLQAALSDTMYSYHGQECEYEPFIDGKETLKEFDKFLQELEK